MLILGLRLVTLRLVAVLAVATLVSGCIGGPQGTPSISDSPSSSPARTAATFDVKDPANYPFVESLSERDRSAVAIGFHVRGHVDLQSESRLDATWRNAQASWFYEDLIQKVDGRFVRIGQGATDALEVCRGDETGSTVEGCPPGDVHRKSGVIQYEPLEPGFYVYYVAAFGSNRSSIEVELRSTKPLVVAWQEPLNSNLTYMHGPVGNGTYHVESALDFHSTNYVLMRMVGPGSPRTFGARYTDAPPAIDFVLEKNEIERYIHPEMGMVNQPHFGAPAGHWQFNATGEVGEAVVIGLIGTLEKPPFLNQDGTFITELESGPHPFDAPAK